jgi:hypothetical protein
MSRTPNYAFLIVAGLAVSATPVRAQAVISVRSGVVHYFEGAVTLNGRPLEAHLGRFPEMSDGAELRTGQAGKAEILLTPGVFLRVGENSGIRMVASALSNTRVELLAGAAVVDSREKEGGAPVTLMYKVWGIRQPEKGVYRVDADPPRVQVTEGEAEASNIDSAPVKVTQGMELPLTDLSATERPASDTHDALNDWEKGRSEAISADNAIAANIQDPASMPGMDLGTDGFTYFPMLPFPSTGTSIGPVYGSAYGYAGVAAPLLQPGFFAVYLPGYTRRPIGLPLPSAGLSGLGLTGFHRGIYNPTYNPTLPYTPPRIGGVGMPLQHAPLTHPRPATVAPHPAGAHPAMHHR